VREQTKQEGDHRGHTSSTSQDAPLTAAWWLVADEMTLRLTDACKSPIRRRDVGMRRSPGGVQVRHGAARCGQNCGHAVSARCPTHDQRWGTLDLKGAATPASGFRSTLRLIVDLLTVNVAGLTTDSAQFPSPIERRQGTAHEQRPGEPLATSGFPDRYLTLGSSSCVSDEQNG
jgi:hypothetical protein